METKEILRKQLELLAERSKAIATSASPVYNVEPPLTDYSHAMCEIALTIHELDKPDTITADQIASQIADCIR